MSGDGPRAAKRPQQTMDSPEGLRLVSGDGPRAAKRPQQTMDSPEGLRLVSGDGPRAAKRPQQTMDSPEGLRLVSGDGPRAAKRPQQTMDSPEGLRLVSGDGPGGSKETTANDGLTRGVAPGERQGPRRAQVEQRLCPPRVHVHQQRSPQLRRRLPQVVLRVEGAACTARRSSLQNLRVLQRRGVRGKRREEGAEREAPLQHACWVLSRNASLHPCMCLWLACLCAARHLIRPVVGLRPRQGVQTDAKFHTRTQGKAKRRTLSLSSLGRPAGRPAPPAAPSPKPSL